MSLLKLQMSDEQVLGYLDNAIREWRTRVKKAEIGTRDHLIATCYVDAFQSTRVSLFLELLSSEG